VIPHRWDGSRWICLRCGAIRPDPCNCGCHEYRILVTGSRNWPAPRVVFTELARFTGVRERITVVHGGNRHGADRFAVACSIGLGFAREQHRADWGRHRKAAGMIRNKTMVDLGADVCLAFIAPCVQPKHAGQELHGSHGAAGCADLAEQAGIPVRRFFDGWDPGPPDPARDSGQLHQPPLPLPGL
jgi:hypothetical protein